MAGNYSLGEATLGTSVDRSGLQGGLAEAERNAKSWLTGFGRTFLLGTAAVAGAGIAAVGGLATKAIGEAGDAVEMMSKFDVVFGDSAEAVRESLTRMSAALGRSKFDLQEMAASVQDTFVPLGFARDEAAKMSETMTQLAIDVGSFNNASATDVMRDFQSAIVGNHETVRKYGIVITQVALDSELLRMGIEGGVSAATEQEKVLARMNLIMAGTTDAQGDAARTADSWANQMVSLKAAIHDTVVEIGLKLLPIVRPLLQTITSFVRDSGPGIIAWVGTTVEKLAGFGQVVLDLTRYFIALIEDGDWLNDWFTHLPEKMQGPVLFLGRIVSLLMEKIPEAIATVRDWFENKFLVTLGNVKDFIENDLFGAFRPLVEWFELKIPDATAVLANLWDTRLKPLLETIGGLFGIDLHGSLMSVDEIMKVVKATIESDVIPALDSIYTFLMEKLLPKIGELALELEVNLPFAYRAMRTSLEETTAGIAEKLPVAQAVFMTAFTVMKDAVLSLVDVIVSEAWPPIKNAFDDLTKTLSESGIEWSDVLHALGVGVKTVAIIIGAVVLAVVGILTGLIVGIANMVGAVIRGINSFLQGLAQFWTGVLQVVTGIFYALKGLVTGDTELMKQALQTFADGVKNIIEGLWLQIKGIFQVSIEAVALLIAGFVDGIVRWFMTLYDRLVGHSIVWDIVHGVIAAFASINLARIGNMIIQSLIDGINQMRQRVMDTVNAIANTISNTISSALGIESPSSVMAGFGSNVVEGFALGIEKQAYDAVMAARAASQNISAALAVGAGGTITNNFTFNGPLPPTQREAEDRSYLLTDSMRRRGVPI